MVILSQVIFSCHSLIDTNKIESFEVMLGNFYRIDKGYESLQVFLLLMKVNNSFKSCKLQMNRQILKV